MKTLRYKWAVRVIGKWFLECKYNPLYKYCREKLILKNYNELFIKSDDEGERKRKSSDDDDDFEKKIKSLM